MGVGAWGTRGGIKRVINVTETDPITAKLGGATVCWSFFTFLEKMLLTSFDVRLQKFCFQSHYYYAHQNH